jgi:hypothetical protein
MNNEKLSNVDRELYNWVETSGVEFLNLTKSQKLDYRLKWDRLNNPGT